MDDPKNLHATNLQQQEKGEIFLTFGNVWGILAECKNTLHIIEFLLITPFSNAKLEHMFWQMLRVKSD